MSKGFSSLRNRFPMVGMESEKKTRGGRDSLWPNARDSGDNISVRGDQQERYDEAMYRFSQNDYSGSIEILDGLLAEDGDLFDARLSLGMAFCRLGDFGRAIIEGHKAERLRPDEQLVHTNLSLFYMRHGEKAKAEHHGLQARIASWKGNLQPPGEDGGDSESELSLVKPEKKPYRTPEKFPEMPWKKKE